MRDWIEIASLFVLLLIMVGLVGYGAYWLYDCFYGEWLDEPIVKAVEERPRPRPETYQVQPGDTIWGIYTEFYQGCDWDEVRYKIRKINGLKNDTLYAYEVISLPDVEEKKKK
jgi:hypothetical protein